MSNDDNAPRPELVTHVRQAWAEVLDTTPDAVPVDVGFFDAGGNSMLLVLLSDVLDESGERSLDPVDLFQHSTVLAQAALLADRDAAGVHG